MKCVKVFYEKITKNQSHIIMSIQFLHYKQSNSKIYSTGISI